MEDWQIDFEWLRVQHYIKETMDRDTLPDLNAVLFLLGIQESGIIKTSFSKEEKENMMHIAVCTLLEEDGYFEFVGRDHDGWPHWKSMHRIEKPGVAEQEKYLKEKVILYFKHNHFS